MTQRLFLSAFALLAACEDLPEPAGIRPTKPCNPDVQTCDLTPNNVCGNGVLERHEECDRGAMNSNEPGSVCSARCKQIAIMLSDPDAPPARVGEFYSHELHASARTTLADWGLAEVSNPISPGLEIGFELISGTPREARLGEAARLTLELTDREGVRAHAALELPVLPRFAQTISCENSSPTSIAVRDNFLLVSNCLFVRDANGAWSSAGMLGAGSRSVATDIVATDDLILIATDQHRDDYVIQVYYRTGESEWSEPALLRPDEGTDDAWFGQALDLEGETLAVLGLEPDVHIFTRTASRSWALEATLDFPHEHALTGLALAGDLLVLGSARDNRAFIFERSGARWNPTGEIAGPDSTQFGYDVETDGARIFISAPFGELRNGTGAVGLVHVYEREQGAWREREVFKVGGNIGHLALNDGVLFAAGVSGSGRLGVYAERADGTWQDLRFDPPPGVPFEGFAARAAHHGDTWMVLSRPRAGLTAHVYSSR